MTGSRGGHGAGPQNPRHHVPYGAYGGYEAYEADGAFTAAVDGLADPLNDPLPDEHASPWARTDNAPAGESAYEASYGSSTGPQTAQGAPNEWYDPAGYQRDWYGPQEPSGRIAPETPTAPAGPAAPAAPMRHPASPTAPMPHQASPTAPMPHPAAEPPAAPVNPASRGGGRAPEPPAPDFSAEPRTALFDAVRATDAADAGPRTEVLSPVTDDDPDPSAAPPPGSGGRAERRRAAKGRGRRRPEPAPERSGPSAPAPVSRLEARRAARAAKDSPAVVASRLVGETFISLGVLMLLFVTYQLWWTNVRAEQIAGKETNRIQDEWANSDRTAGAFEAGQGFAIMHIPKLDVVAPIAEGINKEKVLDRGLIGHYGEGKLKTAMPSDKKGNFAVAGHRNTHGEPFRYINKLKPGDPIVVETRDAYYTYEMASILPQTSPSNVSVIEPVPVGSGFKEPGRYLTLTTCTPEFTSTYRMIVWGKMVDERPRSEGKPDALVG
ncbi:class E sortase [Streptomyces sp. SP18CM02]|uniref:class E sortase n=1 Tax=Streptomyces sp. SP18CM02 TaxID=2758571 RepID=UPI00168AC21F|nr:class E sortase [Streptomyces sp. SP18CM02]MBD3554494.1 class E sortase [Streptomyces sp. SP18CM02]